MARQTKAEKLAEKRIEVAYRTTCSGVMINMLDIPKVFAAGKVLIEKGVDDATLGLMLRTYVDTLASK